MEFSRIGPYRLIEDLGQGGAAKVYLAEAVDAVPGVPEGTRVALKLLNAQTVPGSSLLERFTREIELGRTLRHVHVARTIDAGEARLNGQNRYYLAMEFVPGQTLARLLEVEGAQSEALCRHVGLEVARGLEAIHALGVVHRDIKPANLLLGEDNEVKILDLGVARVLHDSGTLSQIGAFVGSIPYAAPEQFGGGGCEGVDGRADLHALGLVLYEMATGQRAFDGQTLGEVLDQKLRGTVQAPGRRRPGLSPLFDAVVLALLEKDPGRRPARASLLAKILAEGEASSWWESRVRSAAAPAGPRSRLPVRAEGEISLYGRAGDLAALRAAWDAARHGDGRVVFVGGEEGVGRTRLLHELALGLADDRADFFYLEGRASPAGAADRVGVLGTAFRAFFGRGDLEKALESYLGDSPRLLAAFAALLRGEPPVGSAPFLEFDVLQALFVRVTRALAAERPVILVLDDVQDASAEGRAVIAALVRAARGHRILLLCASRHDVATEWRVSLLREPHVRSLELARLGREDVEALLAEALGSEHTAAAISEEVADLSGGNPLFALELIEAHRQVGNLQLCEGGSWVLVANPKPLSVPSAVRGVIAVRLARLAPADRDLLEVAAVYGPRFDAAVVASVLGRPLLEVLRALGRLERDGRMVRSDGGLLRFDPRQIQTILEDEVSVLLREEYHAAIGCELEEKLDRREPGRAAGSLGVQVCHHLLHGNRGGAALGHLDAALEHLRGTYSGEEALELLDRVLEVDGLVVGSRRARLLERQAELLGIAGRNEERGRALTAALKALREEDASSLRARLLLALGDNERRAGHAEQASARAQDALERARDLGDLQLEGGAAILLGNVDLGQGRFEEGTARFERALACAVAAGDVLAEAKATGSLARAQIRQGATARAVDTFRRSLDLFERADDTRLTGVAAGNLGAALVSAAQPAEARPHLQRAYDIARQVGSRRGAAMALGNLGLVASCLGRPAEALRLSEQDLAIHRELGDVPHEVTALLLCGGAAIELGEHDLARKRLREGLDLSRRLGHTVGEAQAMESLGLLAAVEGRLAEAKERFAETQAFALQHALRSEEMAACFDSISTAYWLGEPDRIEPLCRQVEALAGEDLPPVYRVGLAAHRATLPGGQLSPVFDALRREGANLTVTNRMEAWELVSRASGRRAHLEEAYHLHRRILESLTSPQQARMVEGVPVHRRLAAAGREAGLTP